MEDHARPKHTPTDNRRQNMTMAMLHRTHLGSLVPMEFPKVATRQMSNLMRSQCGRCDLMAPASKRMFTPAIAVGSTG